MDWYDYKKENLQNIGNYVIILDYATHCLLIRAWYKLVHGIFWVLRQQGHFASKIGTWVLHENNNMGILQYNTLKN